MAKVAVTARVRAKEGKAEELIAAFAAAAGAVLGELIAESELIVGEPLSGKNLPG